MRFNPLSGLIISLLLLSTPLLRAEQPERVTTGADIIRMHKGGLKEDTILDFLKTYQAMVVLKGEDLADMAAAGFTNGFVQQLLAYVKTQPAETKDAQPKEEVRPKDEETPQRAPGEPRPRRGYDPAPPPTPEEDSSYPAEDYPTTFYVGYPYDYWAFPFWFYAGFHIPFYGYGYHHGYYGHSRGRAGTGQAGVGRTGPGWSVTGRGGGGFRSSGHR